MKQAILIMISLSLATVSYGQLNVFSEGDVVSADKMNQNFQHLEQQFRGTRTTTVNCAAGQTINEAIDQGYTNITVSGTCTENLQYSMWREDTSENNTPTGKLAPRFLKIAGAGLSAKIVDASSNTESTVSVHSGVTLFMKNITVSGGQYGLNAQRNSNLYLSGVTVENFTERGVRVADSAWLGINEDGATIVGTENSTGIEIVTGSSSWISSVSISGVDRGLAVFGGSMAYLGSYQISAISRGINVGRSRFLSSGDFSRSIEGTSDFAVRVYDGVFTNFSGNLEIKNTSGGGAFYFGRSTARVNNLKMTDYDGTTSGGSAIEIYSSFVELENVEISGSADHEFIRISEGSFVKVRDSTITVTNSERGLDVSQNSGLNFRDSTVSGTLTDGSLFDIDGGSYAYIRDSNVSGTVTGGDMVSVSSGSSVNLRGSTISGTASVGSMSMLSISRESSMGAVSCSGKSYASASDSTVPTLPDSCTQ